ncbi:MAG: head-tail connector protein [Aquamicrobium sp.]|uniref:head-tail connector protein n=1 Tax=Aquamicrobium sp. TaxID=1872579 RepID=UPI00349E7446|nr:head-tail connector protein [Aquamicrobium sp.]
MTLFRTVAPAAEPVTLSEAKRTLRLDHDSEDELIGGLIRAAREEVEASCGLALIDQSWRLALDRMPRSGRVLLRRHPVREVLSVTVYGSEGEASLVDPASYRLDGTSRPARLHFRAVPAPGVAMNGIEIDFSAGFGEAGTDVPDLLKRAMLVLVAHWYEFRASFSGADQPVSFPPGYERLIAPWRSRRL